MILLILYSVGFLAAAIGFFVCFWGSSSSISLLDLALLLLFSLIVGVFCFIAIPAFACETRVGKRIAKTINDFWTKPRWKT